MSNADTVYSYLTAQGLPPASAAGVVGNLQGESGKGLATNVPGDNGTSYGIAQWHNERWTRLKAFAASLGRPQSDIGVQQQYLVAELKSRGLWDKLKATTDVNEAVSLMVTQFELPKDPAGAIARRQPLAQQFYASKGGPNAPSASVDTSSSSAGGGATFNPAGLLDGGVDWKALGLELVFAGGAIAIVAVGFSVTFKKQIGGLVKAALP